MRVEHIRRELADRLAKNDFVIDKTGVRTIEILGSSFVADEPRIFGDLNEDWSRREIAWYESMSLNVNDIPPPIPTIWTQVADGDGFINSNYGWCIFSEENGLQYRNALNELKKNPYSRRAVMIYNRPSMWTDYDRNGRSDFMCTAQVEYFIRNERLHAVVKMRSNDLIFGYKGDRYWQRHVLDMLARDLGGDVRSGTIYWQAGSAHVYERHFYLVDNWIKTGEFSISKEEYRERYPNWGA